MKTVVEELIEQLERFIPEVKNSNLIDKAFWREKEKQQIIDVAIEFGFHGEEMMQERGEQYYNEVYGK